MRVLAESVDDGTRLCEECYFRHYCRNLNESLGDDAF